MSGSVAMMTRAAKLAALLLFALAPSAALAQGQGGASTGTEYVLFWRGDLRIIATQDNTQVTILDVETGLPLGGFYAANIVGNPFELRNAGESFEANNGTATYHVRIIAENSRGPRVQKEVIVWTGSLENGLKHPASPPTAANAWMSNIPTLAPGSLENGTEIGRNFWGFASREMYVYARKGPQPTQVLIEDLATNVELDTDDTLTLTPASPYLVAQDAFMEIYYLDVFEDDTVHVTANTDISLSVGVGSRAADDWTITPPSWGAGEDARELGTLFYTFVGRDLTIFPTQDNTTITITDMSDGDDSASVTLQNGDVVGDYDVFITDTYARNGTGVTPRPASPAVRLVTLGASAPFDADFVKIESDRPVLVYVGPKASNTSEFADVAYTVRTGPTSYLLYAYAQNGGADDLHMLAFNQSTNVRITWLTYTTGFRNNGGHDFSIPVPTNWTGGNATTNDWYFSSGIWNGELLRFESDGPITIIDGDYDGPNYGCFIPFVADSGLLKPIADCGPDYGICPGESTVTLDGSRSFDADSTAGAFSPRWTWDVDAAVDSDGNGNPSDDVDLSGPVVVHTFPGAGPYVVTLTYWDDDGQSDTDVLIIGQGDTTPPVITCPVLVSVDADAAGQAFAPVLASATDDCDDALTISNDRTSGGFDASDVYPCGDTIVTFSATDAFGNSAQCLSRVNVRDVTPPALSSPPTVTGTTDATGQATVVVQAAATDACDPAVLIANDRTAGGADATDAYPCGSTIVTFTATDAAGNTSTSQTEVVVADGTPPVAACPPSVDVPADTPTSGRAVVLGTATDDCDPDVAIANDRTAGGADATDDYPCGATVVTFTATDDAGLTDECTTIVNVAPPAAPVAVGAALRVRKDAVDPRNVVHLHWDLAPARQPWEHYRVYRDSYSRPVSAIRPFDAASLDPSLTVTTWTDTAAGGRLWYYEVFTADCAGNEAIDR